jgi:hypothetical protein
MLLDDLNLEVDETGRIVSVWGLCPHTRWTDADLCPPKAEHGDLFVLPDRPLQRGVSIPFAQRKYFPTFVDRRLGWVQVRCGVKSASAVMIIPGIVFEIGDDGELCSLWLNPQTGISHADAV